MVSVPYQAIVLTRTGSYSPWVRPMSPPVVSTDSGGLSRNETSRGGFVPTVVKNLDPNMIPLVVGATTCSAVLARAPVEATIFAMSELLGLDPT